MVLRNCWYVAAWSRDIGRTLTPRTILGEHIVLYRTAAGTVVALEDFCPHRRLPLSMGRIVGDAVQCGYHGLTFDGAGTCIAAPTQDRIPRNAQVRTWPVVERYGFVWLWPGDAALADPSVIIDIPDFDNPAWGRTAGGDMPVACDYLLVIDNLLDPSHVAWVHVTSFAGAGTDNSPLDLTGAENSITVSRWIMDAPPPPYYRDLVAFSGNADRLQHYQCVLPSVAINMSVYTPAGTGGPHRPRDPRAYVNISYNFITPVGEGTCHYYWFQHRNTDPANQAVSERMNAGARMAFEEDRAILEAVQKGLDTARTPTIDLVLDAGALRFRRLVRKRMEQEQPAEAAVTPQG